MDEATEQSDETRTGADRTADTLALAPAMVPVQVLIALITDPARCKARLAELERKIRAAGEAEAKMTTARAEFEAAATTRAAELARREQAVDERENAVLRAERGLVERENQLRDKVLALRDDDNIIKRRIMTALGISRIEGLQDLPAWNELGVECFGRDAAPDDNDASAIADPTVSPGFDFEPIKGSTITRNIPRSAAARRGLRHVVEPRLAD